MTEGFCFHCDNLLHYTNSKTFRRVDYDTNGFILMVKCEQCNNINRFDTACIKLQHGQK